MPKKPPFRSAKSLAPGRMKEGSFQAILTDDQPIRKDLARRSEVKFQLSPLDQVRVRDRLATVCRKQTFARSFSEVHSVYFDSPALECCHANLHGLSRRTKLRIRWYDSPMPSDHFFLEQKWRENRVTGKHRYEVRFSGKLPSFDSASFQSQLLKIAPSNLKGEIGRLPIPTVHIVYKREHYVSLDRSVRFTVDWDIRFTRPNSTKVSNPILLSSFQPLIVLEAKTEVGKESRIKELLGQVVGRVQRCSKYVAGCQELSLVQKTN